MFSCTNIKQFYVCNFQMGAPLKLNHRYQSTRIIIVSLLKALLHIIYNYIYTSQCITYIEIRFLYLKDFWLLLYNSTPSEETASNPNSVNVFIYSFLLCKYIRQYLALRKRVLRFCVNGKWYNIVYCYPPLLRQQQRATKPILFDIVYGNTNYLFHLNSFLD